MQRERVNLLSGVFPMLVKFSCGCLGLIGIQDDSENRPLIIHPCDLNGDECWEPLSLHRRDMGDKTYEVVSPKKASELLMEMNNLLNEGYKFRRLRTLLRDPEKPL